jgi:glycosyltransferase involved in cell wall biosynthesis
MAARGDRATHLAVVIPAYRAAATIGPVITEVRRTVPAAHIIVVDDGSDDGTAAVARDAGARVRSFTSNRGKGAALAAGLAEAAEAPVIVTLDADGQHDAAAIPRLVAPVRDGAADLVLGARPRTSAMPPGRRFNNWLSASLVSRVAGYPVPDAQTGFRACARAVTRHVRPDERRYDYELAFLLGALAAGFRVASVPVRTIYDGAASHFRAVSDTWRMAAVFARYGRAIMRGARGQGTQ